MGVVEGCLVRSPAPEGGGEKRGEWVEDEDKDTNEDAAVTGVMAVQEKDDLAVHKATEEEEEEGETR